MKESRTTLLNVRFTSTNSSGTKYESVLAASIVGENQRNLNKRMLNIVVMTRSFSGYHKNVAPKRALLSKKTDISSNTYAAVQLENCQLDYRMTANDTQQANEHEVLEVD
ncbi:hypothetical protein DICVIV_07294 [Dictyocaulus viviparus]|uniref:Uncharacterized protein n=1 Tax=Dictyocaulus viviparus TaxID=29172 RepID=A0A0D8XQ15_DICVI|nr:hypothetical protein DICVIV_07294 [Dictyocaulus viviparus]